MNRRNFVAKLLGLKVLVALATKTFASVEAKVINSKIESTKKLLSEDDFSQRAPPVVLNCYQKGKKLLLN